MATFVRTLQDDKVKLTRSDVLCLVILKTLLEYDSELVRSFLKHLEDLMEKNLSGLPTDQERWVLEQAHHMFS